MDSRVLTLRGLVLSSAWGRRPAAPDGRSPASCLERGGYAAVPRTSAFPRFRGSSAPAGGFGGDGPLHPWARAHLGPGAHLGPYFRDSPLLPQELLTPFGFGRRRMQVQLHLHPLPVRPPSPHEGGRREFYGVGGRPQPCGSWMNAWPLWGRALANPLL